MTCRILACLAAVLFAMPQTSWAQTGDAPSISATISPLHLIFPVVEVAVERAFSDRVSGAVILGAGTIHQEGLAEATVIYELGVQGRFYFFDNFEGAHGGFEALYLGASHDEEGVEVGGEGLAVGPLLGWKFVLKSGFVVDVQGGYQIVVVKAEASEASSGATASASQSEGVPLFNVNLGFSF